MSGSILNLFHLGSGNMVSQIPTYNPIASSYFENYRFNNSDSTIYGLARRLVYDSITFNTIGEVYLAKINTQTGIITQISPNSVSQGFALAGSAIDPHQMVYYFSVGSNLIGLDMYTGLVYSNAPIQVNNGIVFDNFTYSCADTALYGLIRQNYFSYVYDTMLNMVVQVFDSATVKLGRIDPTTGIVTTISPVSLLNGGYSLNASAAIDPNTMTYYFGNGASIIGVSLITGLQTSSTPCVFEDGMYFDLMRNFESCKDATKVRTNPTTVDVAALEDVNSLQLYPNPANDYITVSSTSTIASMAFYGIDGKLVFSIPVNSTQPIIDISKLPAGVYMIQVTLVDGGELMRKVVIAD
jgi:Secretion system C-terminal sorting domain